VKPDLLSTYISRLYNELQTLNNLAVKTTDVEAVHDMRVQIKRLNCVYSFLEESKISGIKSQEYYVKLRRYFKIAGRLRELQLHRSLINRYKELNGDQYQDYEQYITAIEGDARDHFHRNRSSFPIKEQKALGTSVLNSVKKTSPSALYKHAVVFITDRIKKIESYYLHYETEEYLHKTRQTIKDLRYFLELFVACSDSPGTPSIEFVEIKQVEEVLGGWNDKQVFCEDLSRFYKNYRILHGGNTLPVYESLISQVSEDASREIVDIQPVLLSLITYISLSLLRLK